MNLIEWRIKLLGLKIPEKTKTRRGLVLIQIDGLSYPDLERALKKRHLPFLSRLMRREHYRLWRMYSGVPSNTPAFQGEFFFGQTPCIPSFQFLDRDTGKIFTMFEKSSASEVEKRMLEKDEGLLAGGSAYCNIFSGGAAESHVCASTADWVNALKVWNPYSLMITFLLNPYGLLRGLFLCLAESALAIMDFFRGFLSGQDFFEELRFIFMRVLSAIFLREVATAHAQMDIYRGLPVIHVNYFGYDEQAHRRGPSTRFAYWSLSGIDAAAKKLWEAALKSKRRHYDVWIYSDHGQEKVTPISKISGRPIRKAVKEVYDEIHVEKSSRTYQGSFNGGIWGDTILSKRGLNGDKKTSETKDPVVTTLGPIAQVYFPFPMKDEEKNIFAKTLIEKNPALPLITVPLEHGDVEYQTRDGVYRLPQDAKMILGSGHPYLEEVMGDLITLLRHENRGDMVLFGWCAGREAISFSNENGAHAGLGPQETQAFAILPQDAPIYKIPEKSIRGFDLRRAALILLGKNKPESPRRRVLNDEKPLQFRLMSYNVHSCVGIDGILSVERIARIIAKSNPDVVALQELDMGRKFKGADQAASIAGKLEMQFHFHPVCGAESECFGNAVLSHYPIKVIRAEALPMLRKSAFFEPRGVLWVEIDFEGKSVHILNTHLSLWGVEQQLQIQRLLSGDLLKNSSLGENVILCGDFNMTPGSKFYRRIAQDFKEPKFYRGDKINPNTWTSQWPIRRLDHIFMRGNLEAELALLPRTQLEIFASDHLPIAADFEVKAA